MLENLNIFGFSWLVGCVVYACFATTSTGVAAFLFAGFSVVYIWGLSYLWLLIEKFFKRNLKKHKRSWTSIIFGAKTVGPIVGEAAGPPQGLTQKEIDELRKELTK